METLNELHFDALSEIVNIGTGRAAQGLGEVIGEAVQSSVPEVQLVKLDDVSAQSLILTDARYGVVTQDFSGDFAAEIMLLFDEDNVLRIVRNMMGTEMELEVVREFENEAMCELGNIMINACLSSIADLLHIPIESSLPRYAIKTREEVLEYIKADPNHDGYVLASHVDLSIEQHPTEGKLFFLVNASALANIIGELDMFIATSSKSLP